jgi:hypothetical protein
MLSVAKLLFNQVVRTRVQQQQFHRHWHKMMRQLASFELICREE